MAAGYPYKELERSRLRPLSSSIGVTVPLDGASSVAFVRLRDGDRFLFFDCSLCPWE